MRLAPQLELMRRGKSYVPRAGADFSNCSSCSLYSFALAVVPWPRVPVDAGMHDEIALRRRRIVGGDRGRS
jgi:hypothetical protein